MKNLNFDLIKILESAKGLCPGFLVHGYLEYLPLLSFKNFGGIPYGRNSPSEGVESLKNVKFDFIKILKSAKGLCRGFLVHGYFENLTFLSLKNFGGIPIGGTPFPRGLKL